MSLTAASLSRSLLASSMAIAVGMAAATAPADARTYRLRVHPGLDQPSSAPQPSVTIAQNTDAAAKDAPAPTPSNGTPPGKVERPPSPATSARPDAGEPPSERALAAAARAKRALAEEDGSLFEGSTPVDTDLVTAEEPAPAGAVGQPLAPDQTRRTAAGLHGQPSATCIAGCK